MSDEMEGIIEYFKLLGIVGLLAVSMVIAGGLYPL